MLEERLLGRDTRPLGDYVSVESAISRGQVTHLAVTGKYPLLAPFRELGQYWPARLPPAERTQVLDLAGAALAALGVRTGIAHTEIKLTAAGPRIIEVNGRLGGFLNELAGLAQPDLNLVRTAGHAALNRPIEPVPDVPDRVHFQYFTPAPPFPCTFVAASGGGDVRALPGVTHLHWPVPRGTRLDGGVGWRALAMVCGDAPDHTAMLELVDRAQALLTFRLAGDGGAAELTGRQLHRCRPADSDGYRVQQL